MPVQRSLTVFEGIIRVGDGLVLVQGSQIVNIESHDIIASVTALGTTRQVFGSLLSLLEAFLVYGHAVLFSHDTGKIDGETVRIIQTPHIRASQSGLTSFLGLVLVALKELLTTIERLGKGSLFLVQNSLDIVHLGQELWVGLGLSQRVRKRSSRDV